MATAGCCTLFFRNGFGPTSGNELFKFVTKWTKKKDPGHEASAADIVALCKGLQLPEHIQAKIEDAILRCATHNRDTWYCVPNYRGFPDDKALFDCYLQSRNERLKRAYLERYIIYRLTISLGSDYLDEILSDPARRQSFNNWRDKIIKEVEEHIYYYEDFSFLSWSRSLTSRFKTDLTSVGTAGN